MIGKTVLLVDDSRVARMMARAVIERHHPGWTVHEAGTGEDAVAIATSSHPDFILVDVNMPGMGGLAAAARLRELHPKAAVSMLTANIQEPVQHQAEHLGVGFITKPIREDALLAFLTVGDAG
ncbi:MAG: response regulator [Magnetospirillum sp.]|nr:response regulator [Magnetospirillum sp.]